MASSGLRELGNAVNVHRHRVVVVGAGFGGLAVAEGRDAPVDVTSSTATTSTLFPPLLYQVATAGLDADDVAYDVRACSAGSRNVRRAHGDGSRRRPRRRDGELVDDGTDRSRTTR